MWDILDTFVQPCSFCYVNLVPFGNKKVKRNSYFAVPTWFCDFLSLCLIWRLRITTHSIFFLAETSRFMSHFSVMTMHGFSLHCLIPAHQQAVSALLLSLWLHVTLSVTQMSWASIAPSCAPWLNLHLTAPPLAGTLQQLVKWILSFQLHALPSACRQHAAGAEFCIFSSFPCACEGICTASLVWCSLPGTHTSTLNGSGSFFFCCSFKTSGKSSHSLSPFLDSASNRPWSG